MPRHWRRLIYKCNTSEEYPVEKIRENIEAVLSDKQISYNYLRTSPGSDWAHIEYYVHKDDAEEAKDIFHYVWEVVGYGPVDSPKKITKAPPPYEYKVGDLVKDTVFGRYVIIRFADNNFMGRTKYQDYECIPIEKDIYKEVRNFMIRKRKDKQFKGVIKKNSELEFVQKIPEEWLEIPTIKEINDLRFTQILDE